jgi:hypothetical protein
MKRPLLLTALATAAVSLALAQQNRDGNNRPPGHPHGHRPPPSLLVAALDANHDHVISADEIANAAAALKALDLNGDGKLSADELMPPRPADAPPPPDASHRPVDPLMLALDANKDGELSADEIANASTSLKALDVNHDGQLTPDEFRPLPPDGFAPQADCPPPQD